MPTIRLARLHAVLGYVHAAVAARVDAALGHVHAAVAARAHALGPLLRRAGGQGTVEYVGLILLVSVILAGVVAAGFRGDAGIAKAITEKLKDAIDSVGGK